MFSAHEAIERYDEAAKHFINLSLAEGALPTEEVRASSTIEGTDANRRTVRSRRQSWAEFHDSGKEIVVLRKRYIIRYNSLGHNFEPDA